jgi:hypothetical protein
MIYTPYLSACLKALSTVRIDKEENAVAGLFNVPYAQVRLRRAPHSTCPVMAMTGQALSLPYFLCNRFERDKFVCYF